MVKFLLASHGKMASGMKMSLNILLGNSDNVTVYDAYVDDSNITEVFEQYFASVSEEDQVIMLSDLYGGSVNQKMYTYLTRPNTFLVAGVNLALVLELVAMSSCGEFTKESLETTIANSREALKLVELDTSSETEAEDEFF